jgi:hypothetical protein
MSPYWYRPYTVYSLFDEANHKTHPNIKSNKIQSMHCIDDNHYNHLKYMHVVGIFIEFCIFNNACK